jgi:hypothetical protein
MRITQACQKLRCWYLNIILVQHLRQALFVISNLMTSEITDIRSRIQRDNTNLGITLYDKASGTQIVEFEKIKGVKLPEDLKIFYGFCNGFESAEDMFRIIPLNEMLENKTDNYTKGEKDFHIAEYMIYCDMWTISIDSVNNNKYTIYKKADRLYNLTNSFAAFLDKFLSGGVFDGLYKWEEEIENSAR